MVDNKSVKSQSWEEDFGNLYSRLTRIVNSLNKRMNLSYDVAKKLKSKLGDVDDAVLDEVWWEISMRFQLEKHMLIDNEFALLSDVTNRYDINGNIVGCSICQAQGKVACKSCKGSGIADEVTREPCHTCKGIASMRCKMCGGSGKMVDHDLTLAYKEIAMTSTAGREIHALSSILVNGGQAGPDPEGIDKMLEGLYMNIYKSMQDGDMSHDEAIDTLKKSLGTAAKAYGAGEEEIDKFVQGFIEFEKRMDADKKPIAIADVEEDSDDGNRSKKSA